MAPQNPFADDSHVAESTEDLAKTIASFPPYVRAHLSGAVEPYKSPKSAVTNYDPRFPNQNQTAHCWQYYVDYFKCINSMGEGYKPCNQFKTGYRLLCPDTWVEKWDEQRENGIFPADLSA
ncbi:cytochrome c oxidase, subunit VIb [Lipomyces oligophaga]|uniref:cytochrome c oxidase, subunit VIb n=1 Tax=Lipomyces oligophaga TaxID=45792 RepID=UPI0034CE585D